MTFDIYVTFEHRHENKSCSEHSNIDTFQVPSFCLTLRHFFTTLIPPVGSWRPRGIQVSGQPLSDARHPAVPGPVQPVLQAGEVVVRRRRQRRRGVAGRSGRQVGQQPAGGRGAPSSFSRPTLVRLVGQHRVGAAVGRRRLPAEKNKIHRLVNVKIIFHFLLQFGTFFSYLKVRLWYLSMSLS